MDFDKKLKQTLDNLEPEYDASTWAMLEQRLDAGIAEEQPPPVDDVDKAVYHTLSRMEMPYQSAHWTLLSQRLQLQKIRLRRLRIAKFAEVAILLLLLWNVDVFFGESSSDSPGIPKPDPSVPIAQASAAGQGRATAFAGTTMENTSGTMYTAATLDILQGVLQQEHAPLLLSGDYKQAGSVVEVLGTLHGLVQQSQAQLYASADLLPYDALAAFSIPERSLDQLAIVKRKYSAPSPFYLAAYGIGDQNSVLVGGTRRKSAGYGAAIALGYRGQKWGIEGGLGFVHKKYAPKREVEIYGGNLADGYFGSTLTEVNADILTIPLKVTRQIARFGKTTMHAIAGITANIASQKNYDYGTVYYSPDALPPNFLPDPSQSPKLQKRGRGVLEKGNLKENFYTSLDAGIRIERPIAGSRYSAFVEPAIRKSIIGKGIGLQRESINTFSIQAGIMAYL